MDFETVVRRRRMVRNFQDRPLPPATVERLLANAQRGPSAGFTQGCDLLVLHGRDQTACYWDVSLPLETRAGFRWPGLLNAPLLVVFLAHRQAYVDRYAEADKHAPHRAWPVPYWHVDTAFAAMLALLTAVDEGLGALFFETHRPDAVKAAFGVPPAYDPTGTVAVGYPAPDPVSASVRRGRRRPHDVVHRGRW